ncbi:MAG TPA: dihydrolipoyl dehydrogenase [Flavobacterium sp.]|jgi:dihydrolipoamide dehydrogenase|uniref:dihydrolipoyl dehydrogenase n=1 Tax=Flavobacterium TaxID=237 RepID=UPI001B50FDF9|nr:MULTISPECIES: dihydrolipoyl dehydrogenase [unclassified Flavobacterium]MBP7183291.1 dihydrolipoyl dehydrogenase [Flavobacterium sp.]MBP7318367.1 dihydrolipoyl dehydrogenase [Flavobacterium sp.]MBP8794007.1 dihydrolipoyl dehydrogenase [Lutibacter sp.]HRL72019.1 dihydrolipoyl dehydrogenase [Flavobacterium sp.]
MQYNLAIIGSGPGGYVAAIRAAQLGLTVAIIEKYSTLGGTCLNVGCIPSKSLLDSSEHFFNATHTFAEHGIKTGALEADIVQMVTRKNGVIRKINDGINYLMQKNKITVYNGLGSFTDKNTIKIIKTDNTEESITADNVIIATGSKPTILPFIPLDKKRIITSTEALSLNEIPKNLIVIGAGVIGAEMGSVFARLGSKISFVEFADAMIPTMDKTMGKELQKSMKKDFAPNFYFSHKVIKVENTGNEVIITAEINGQTVEIKGDYCLVAIGRKPYTEGLNIEILGITLDKGKIPVNEATLETDVKGIYAIGDVIRGAMLAHKASEEGVLVAEIIAGQKPHLNYNLIPNVIYTWPEVASVGQTEEQLKEKGINYKLGSFPFKALGRAIASGDEDGLVKVLADKITDEILGVHIIGARAADMISEAVSAMEFRASSEDIIRTSHAHPTYTEAFREACMATNNKAIHI